MSYIHKTSGPNNITTRAILIGLVLVIVNAYWIGIASEMWYCMFTLVNPFSNAIFTLTFLLALGFALRQISTSLALSPAELLVIYVMVTMVNYHKRDNLPENRLHNSDCNYFRITTVPFCNREMANRKPKV